MKRILLLFAVLVLAIIGIFVYPRNNTPPNSDHVQAKKVLKQAYLKKSLAKKRLAYTGPGTAYFVRHDGGTLYSANMPLGQCDAKSDAPYLGTGVNQHCAVNDYRFMWDDKSGKVGLGNWIIAGGDTVVVRDCLPDPSQVNSSGFDCRLGWDAPTGTGANLWCYGVGSYTCYNPPIPAGTTAQPTRILSGCEYDGDCNPKNSNDPRDYVANLTQIFGGFSLAETFNLQSTQHVVVQGFELTTHNGKCTWNGSPATPRPCANNQPLDDYAQSGFYTNNASADISFQDIYVHGFNAYGFYGPIGGAITMKRVFIGFNGMGGWNFDDGNDTPDGPGSSINASYVTMMGNGFYEEYPIVHTTFPAKAGYDSISNGFGDGWSGQDANLDFFICDHCQLLYNSKDGFIGPHTQIKNLVITNSVSMGNMGAQWKWAQPTNATLTFANNFTVTNCLRLFEQIPGSLQNFWLGTNLLGSYLVNGCRAGGAGFANLERAGGVNNFYNNTVIAAGNIVFQVGCGYYSPGNVFNPESNCASTINNVTNNNFLGYTDPNPILGAPSALYCALDIAGNVCSIASNSGVSFLATFNNEIGFKGGTTDTCGANNITCLDPLLLNEPIGWTTETALDVYNAAQGSSFTPSTKSPLIGVGTPLATILTDFYGTIRSTTNPTLGAVELAGTITPPPPPVQITPTITWKTPANLTVGSILNANQLNATASTAGTFTYSPAVGTILGTVGSVTLSTTFKPTDTVHFTTAKSSIALTVVAPNKPASVTCTTPLVVTLTPTTSGTFTVSTSGCK